MDEKSLFTNFWTKEAKTTQTVLGRIPEGSDYRPDPKSRTAKDIAWQIVNEEKMIIEALETGNVAWAPPPAPGTMKEIVDIYARQSADIAERWKRLPQERWDGSLDFFGHERPASPMAWSFLFDSCIIVVRSRPTSGLWDPLYRRYMDQAGMSPSPGSRRIEQRNYRKGPLSQISTEMHRSHR